MTLFPEVNFNQEPKHFKVVRVMNVREKMVYFGMGLVNFMLNFLPDIVNIAVFLPEILDSKSHFLSSQPKSKTVGCIYPQFSTH